MHVIDALANVEVAAGRRGEAYSRVADLHRAIDDEVGVDPAITALIGAAIGLHVRAEPAPIRVSK